MDNFDFDIKAINSIVNTYGIDHYLTIVINVDY